MCWETRPGPSNLLFFVDFKLLQHDCNMPLLSFCLTTRTFIEQRRTHMKLMPRGDYFVWYCEWCDSRNSTIRTRIGSHSVTCSACQQSFGVGEEGRLFNLEQELREAV